jgi:choice-of-anchor B domain-containing protein
VTRSTLRTAALGAALLALAATAGAHDGDLKPLDKRPAVQNPGFCNATLRSPDGLSATTLQEAATTAFPAHRVTLLSWLTPADFGLALGDNVNSLWGYTSPGGRRYAIVGDSYGTAFVDITVPNNATIVAQLTGPLSFYRDMRTYGHYAYAISEGGGGIQVFDLSQIVLGNVTLVRSVDDVGSGATHTLSVNPVSGYLYRSGGAGVEGLRIYDLNPDPSFPHYVASWTDRYVHQTSPFTLTTGPYAGHEIAFACGGYNGGFDGTALHILDVTDKQDIILKDIETYPGAQYCHQGWLSADEHYYYIGDEFYDGPTTTFVLDVSDLDSTAPRFLSSFTNGNTSVAHNLYVSGDTLYEANYRSGLHVWDLSQSPTAPTETAWFDTDPDSDVPTFNSLWNVYPYFGDGLVIGSDMERGLFVWYVGDPKLTFTLVGGAPAEVRPNLPREFHVSIAELAPGDYATGTAALHVDGGSGFVTSPLTDLGGGDFLARLPATNCEKRLTYYLTAESTDGTVWTEPAGAPFVYHEATATTGFITVFHDDCETDPGWIPENLGATDGDWERGVPVNDPNWPHDPISDSDGSGQCWLTANRLGNSDVDYGAVRLTSPTLDLSQGPARISYDYYFWDNENLEHVDKILVEIDENDGAGPWTEIARHDTSGGLLWRTNVITQADLDAAGVTRTAAMRLRFTVNDDDPQSRTEAGLDAFRIEAARCDGSISFCDADDGSLASCPCGNAGSSDTGCDIQQLTGGVRLDFVQQETSPQNRATLRGTGFPATTSPAVVVIRGPGIEPAGPVAFGDGLRCISVPLVRLAAGFSGHRTSFHGFGHGAGAGAGTFYYQLWFRNTPPMYCTPEAFNLSNGRTLTW